MNKAVLYIFTFTFRAFSSKHPNKKYIGQKKEKQHHLVIVIFL